MGLPALAPIGDEDLLEFCRFLTEQRSARWQVIEEQFDLSPLTVELGDRQCRQGEVVGDEDQILAGLGVLEANASQWCL